MSSICIQIPTDYGPMLVARHDINQTQPLIQTGRAIDHASIQLLVDVAQILGPEAVFADVGANLGTYSMALAPYCKEVHAFEAQRIIFQMLTGSAALSGHQNIWTYQYAVSDAPGELPIPVIDYAKPGQYGGISFAGVSEHRPELPGKELVQARTLDSFNGLHPTLMKIDVEGMEQKVIAGALTTIMLSRPVMLVEYLGIDRDETSSLIPYIQSLRYVVHDLGMDLLCIPNELTDKLKFKRVPKEGP